MVKSKDHKENNHLIGQLKKLYKENELLRKQLEAFKTSKKGDTDAQEKRKGKTEAVQEEFKCPKCDAGLKVTNIGYFRLEICKKSCGYVEKKKL